jgi:uncharacterized membrane protein
VAFALTLVGAALACALELLEALAIVLAVGLERRPRDAVLGAGAAVVICLVVGVVLGPALTGRVAIGPLRFVVGVALLLFGMEWLRKGVLRMAGRRSRSDSFAEFEEERAELASVPVVATGPDWAARAVAFKGVLLEGMEVVLIVSALAARPGGRAPALLGAGVAVVATVGIGALLHRPLRRVPESELKLLVGLVLTTFGTFFTAEGLGVHWPLGDAALLVLAAWWAALAFLLVRREALA